MAIVSGFDLNYVNYAPITIGTALLLFGGWYLLSARKWFTGPVPMGTLEELERFEVAQAGKFTRPADTAYEPA